MTARITAAHKFHTAHQVTTTSSTLRHSSTKNRTQAQAEI